ncbi:MAG: hypothetical protein ACREBE_29575 [bacterium]
MEHVRSKKRYSFPSARSPLQRIPTGTAAEMFRSPDVLFAILDLDVQLPWVAAGEINRGALNVLLGSQAGLFAFRFDSSHEC